LLLALPVPRLRNRQSQQNLEAFVQREDVFDVGSSPLKWTPSFRRGYRSVITAKAGIQGSIPRAAYDNNGRHFMLAKNSRIPKFIRAMLLITLLIVLIPFCDQGSIDLRERIGSGAKPSIVPTNR
jgi:hypothetical protein